MEKFLWSEEDEFKFLVIGVSIIWDLLLVVVEVFICYCNDDVVVVVVVIFEVVVIEVILFDFLMKFNIYKFLLG